MRGARSLICCELSADENNSDAPKKRLMYESGDECTPELSREQLAKLPIFREMQMRERCTAGALAWRNRVRPVACKMCCEFRDEARSPSGLTRH
jgi:hypothetical protein